MTDGSATTCGRHKADLLGSPVVDFEATCNVACCKKKALWGIDGQQPSHCLDHGPLQEGLTRTVGTDRIQRISYRRSLYRAVKGPSVRIKDEKLL